jgi:hypothetical protein
MLSINFHHTDKSSGLNKTTRVSIVLTNDKRKKTSAPSQANYILPLIKLIMYFAKIAAYVIPLLLSSSAL